MKFIASCQTPERQIALLECHGDDALEPEGVRLIPDALQRFAVTSEENLSRVVLTTPSVGPRTVGRP